MSRRSIASIAPLWKSALARGVWLAAVAVTLYGVGASIPQFAAQLRTPCVGSACQYQQLTYPQAAALPGLGLSVETYVVVTMAFAAVTLLVCLAISAVIIWRKPGDRMAVLVALLLAVFGPVNWIASLAPGSNLWVEPQFYVPQLTSALFAVVFSLFPTGRFEPRWLLWVMVAFLVWIPLSYLGSSAPLLANVAASRSGWLVALAQMLTLMVAQIYRYRRISTPIQRQQTKWVIGALATAATALGVGTAVTLIAPTLGWTSDIFALLYDESGFLIPLLVAVGFGFAIMRYRLWEIDTLINRALVYGALTLILTGLYAGLVIGLQTLSRGLIGQNNSPVIVLSTLVIAAIVLPLRRGLQAVIDRAFYRSHFDSARTLAAFSATLRHEVRVEALRQRLLDAVQETMQPAHCSLWLRPEPLKANGREGEE